MSRPADWDSFLAAIARANVLDTFLDATERAEAPQTQELQSRDPFEGWVE